MEQEVLVLRDATGQYYLISWETLEAARVPAEQQADLERRLAGEDVGGFVSSITDGTSNTISFGDGIRGARPSNQGTAFTGGVFVGRTLTLLPYIEQDN